MENVTILVILGFVLGLYIADFLPKYYRRHPGKAAFLFQFAIFGTLIYVIIYGLYENQTYRLALAFFITSIASCAGYIHMRSTGQKSAGPCDSE